MKIIPSILLILSALCVAFCKDYNVYNIEDDCKTEGKLATYTLGRTKESTAGIVKTNGKYKIYTCNINFTTSIARTGIVFSIRRLQLPKNCNEYSINIYTSKSRNYLRQLCDKIYDSKESESFIINDLPLRLEYRANSPRNDIKLEFILTTFSNMSSSDLNFKCDNNRYISSSLTCDGHNNCGDQSDESRSGNSKCVFTVGTIAGIAIGCLLFIALIAGAIWCCSRRTVITTYTSYNR